jgi:hypothetical protein
MSGTARTVTRAIPTGEQETREVENDGIPSFLRFFRGLEVTRNPGESPSWGRRVELSAESNCQAAGGLLWTARCRVPETILAGCKLHVLRGYVQKYAHCVPRRMAGQRKIWQQGWPRVDGHVGALCGSPACPGPFPRPADRISHQVCSGGKQA